MSARRAGEYAPSGEDCDVPIDVPVDVCFALVGTSVMADYALALWQALRVRLPWLVDESLAGIHPLSGVSAGAGMLYLGHRARLVLRLPRQRLQDAHALCGQRLDLGGRVDIGAASVRMLQAGPAQYSPFVALPSDDEPAFIEACRRRLLDIEVDCELLCGKPQARRGECDGDNMLRGYSLLLHGLSDDAALRVQALGLGEARNLGCGLFVRHKSIAAVGSLGEKR